MDRGTTEAMTVFEGQSQPGDAIYVWRTIANWQSSEVADGFPAEADEVYRIERVK